MATGGIARATALVFGGGAHGRSTLWFALVVNVLSAVLSLVAIALYAVGYTVLLKRRTSQNIVWGGRRVHADPHRLVGRHRDGRLAGGRALPGHLLLDPAALLAAVHGVP